MKRLYFFTICLFTFIGATAQEKLSKEEKERRERNIQAGNPFKQFGYKGKVATLSKGKYLEVHDLDSIVTIGSVRFHVDRKEIVGSVQPDISSNEYSRPIGDVASRWMSPDPLAEEYPDWTPYRYGLDNPIRYADPTGLLEDDYGISDNGDIKLIKETDDKTDRLFAVDDKGNKKDVNSSGTVNNSDSVEVGKGILNQMTSIRSGSEKNVEGGYTSAIAEQSPQTIQDYQSIFKFAADNSSAEFSLTSFSHKGRDLIQLSTFGDSAASPSPFQLGISNPNKNVSNHMHSHPDIRTHLAVENNSMGGDYRNAKADNRQYPNKVYFPNSSRLYQVTTQGTLFLKKVKTSKDF